MRKVFVVHFLSKLRVENWGRVKKIAVYLLLSVGGMAMIWPFLWLVGNSLKLDVTPVGLPEQGGLDLIGLRNYWSVWKVMPYGQLYMNSLFITVGLTIAQVITSLLAAYAFAKLKFPGRDVIFLAYLVAVIVHKNPVTNKLKKALPFILVEAGRLSIKENSNFAIVKREELNKIKNTKALLTTILESYKKERKIY